MGALFSDRFWLLKLAIAGACFSWLCHRAYDQISAIDPPEYGVPLRAKEWHGLTLHLHAKPVLAERADGYEIETYAGPATLVAPKLAGVKAGDRISAHVRIEGPRLFSAPAVQLNRGHAWKRPLNYALSVGVLAALLWLWRDRLRVRLREGLFRART